MLHDMPHTVIASAQPSCMWRSPQAQDTSLQTLSGYCTSSATQGWKMTSRASGSLLQNRTAFSIDALGCSDEGHSYPNRDHNCLLTALVYPALNCYYPEYMQHGHRRLPFEASTDSIMCIRLSLWGVCPVLASEPSYRHQCEQPRILREDQSTAVIRTWHCLSHCTYAQSRHVKAGQVTIMHKY